MSIFYIVGLVVVLGAVAALVVWLRLGCPMTDDQRRAHLDDSDWWDGNSV